MSFVRGPVLPVSFFDRAAPEVARDLLGAVLVSRIRGRLTAGRIVETEAYLGVSDPASHAYRGRRHDGNASIYLSPGTWYVYRSYGVHWCANLVTAPAGEGAAVLIRALEPLEGIPTMRSRRQGGRRARPISDSALCDGPGKLTQALGITRGLDGRLMPATAVVVAAGQQTPAGRIVSTRRVGITKAANRLLRYVVR